MAYNSGLASQIMNILRGSSNIREIKDKLEIVYIVCLELHATKELADTAEKIYLDSGIAEHFFDWCFDQGIRVLEDDDFMDFLKTEQFTSKEKLVLPLINPRITFFPELLTEIIRQELRRL